MGSISRMERAGRFMEAFQDRAEHVFGFVPKQPLHVSGVTLGEYQDEVRAYATIVDGNGTARSLCFDDVLFDPDYTETNNIEQLEEWAETFGLSVKEVRRRLKEANL